MRCCTATAGLLLCLLAAIAQAKSAALPADPDGAWRNYLARDTGIEADYQFPHAQCFRRSALVHQLPETLLLAVARGESNFEASARSRANAHGVMQIQWPGTAQHLGITRLSALYDPCTNIDAGTRYLKELLERYDGNLHLSLAAYNYGPGRIKPGATSIPSGATWYSAYIFRHLGFVLGDRRNATNAPSLYSDVGRSVLLSFGEPYRAAAFVQRLDTLGGDIQVDWFREGVGQFDVVLTYASKEEYTASARQLRAAGFPVR